jgi:hypothetical protein
MGNSCGNIKENGRFIVSIYDATGNWPAEYIQNGYGVILWDYKYEGDILAGFTRLVLFIKEAIEAGYHLAGCLFAPPCTHMAGSGARWWELKDKQSPADGDVWNEVEYHKAYIEICLHLVQLFKPMFPKLWWALENPIGRLETLLPHFKQYRSMTFNPCDYGDAYTKKTILWGEFNTDLPKTPVKPVMYELNGKKGSYMWAKLGGKSERTKALRSATPMGFAKAFYQANH